MLKILSLSIILATTLTARFADESETCYSVEQSKQTVTIKKDGSYEVLYETTYLIKNEKGRDELSKSVDIYRDGTEKVEILEAKTILDGKEFPVKKESIEDKELASSTNGFASKRQVIVAYPQAQVGAKLYKKTKFKSTLIIVKDHFTDLIQPLEQGWTKHTEITIDSEIPLKKIVNDPNDFLDVKVEDEKDGYFKKAIIKLKKPGTSYVINDIMGHLAFKKSTWVALSSLDKWDDMLKDIMPKYDEVLNSELPPIYKKIIEAAKTKTTDVDKIQTVISLLNENVQYLGSWMTFNGMFIPRSFADVEKTRFGDCKDFATGTVAMLRTLGFKAEVICVNRGQNQPDYMGLGLPIWFANHVMVKAIGSDSKVYWLDPTNFVSTTYILPDDANRSVIVPIDHENKKSALEKTPEVDPFVVKKTDTVYIKEDDRLEHHVDLTMSETFYLASGITGIQLRISPQLIEDFLYQSLAAGTVKKEDRLEAKIPELKDRVIKPIDLSLKFLSDDLISSNVGKAYIYKTDISFIKFIQEVRPEESVNDWLVDFSETKGLYDYKTVFLKKHIQNPKSLDFCLETPWFKISREAKIEGDDTVVYKKVQILTPFIPNEDLKSETFIKAQKEIISKFEQIVIELEDKEGNSCFLTSWVDKAKSLLNRS